MRVFAWLLAPAAMTLATGGKDPSIDTAPQPGPSSAGICTVSALQPKLPNSLILDRADWRDATGAVPAFCEISAHLTAGSRIGIEIGLPVSWNGKFLFLGVGGFGGQSNPLRAGLVRGYATASTDTGHVGTSRDISWALNNKPAVINHFESGVPMAVEAAKAVTTAFYGNAPRYAYFDGCSGGGRQGLVEAERFPSQFDGIIAGAPAWDYANQFAQFVETSNYLLARQDRWLSPAQMIMVDKEVLRQCDQVDGIEDGIVGDPGACHVRLGGLLCKSGARNGDCLTQTQVDVIDYIRAPRRFGKGFDFPGYTLDGDSSDEHGYGWPHWILGTKPPFADNNGQLNYPGGSAPAQADMARALLQILIHADPKYDTRRFRIARDGAMFRSPVMALADADRTDLGAFARKGGKLLIWHGWSDAAVPVGMSVDLYRRILRDTKEPLPNPVSESVRLFLVPGVQHCHFGSGLTDFDPLSAMEKWVEQGAVPASMIGTRGGGLPASLESQVLGAASTAERKIETAINPSRPICAFPQTARYNGTGDPNRASNFSCVASSMSK